MNAKQKREKWLEEYGVTEFDVIDDGEGYGEYIWYQQPIIEDEGGEMIRITVPQFKDDRIACKYCEGTGIRHIANGVDDYDEEVCDCVSPFANQAEEDLEIEAVRLASEEDKLNH